MRRRIRQMTRSKRRWLLKRAAVSVTGAALLLALAQSPAAHAANITVNTTTANGFVADGDCSLSEAIANANDTTTGQPYIDCAAGDPVGADTIILAGNTYTLNSAYGGAAYWGRQRPAGRH